MSNKKVKFNIIDFAVILLVIVAIAGFVVRFGLPQTKSINDQTKFRYVVKVENVREFTANALKQSEQVTDKKSNLDVGQIVGIEIEDAISNTSLANGKVISATLPERYNCIVTIEATGNEYDDKYMLIDETELAVGRTTELYTKYAQTSGIIKSVEVIR